MALGVFVGLTEAQILAIRDQARADITAGKITTSYTVPGGAMSVSKQHIASTFHGMGPSDILNECRYALQKLDPDTYGSDLTTSRTKSRFL